MNEYLVFTLLAILALALIYAHVKAVEHILANTEGAATPIWILLIFVLCPIGCFIALSVRKKRY
ncbi:MAG: hypothetical protein AAF226_11900 [Verrucomicrobiota bacterium]